MLGWWFEVRPGSTGASGRHRAARWLVGIEDEMRARLRLAEEVAAQDDIAPLRQASASELKRYHVGPLHLREV